MNKKISLVIVSILMVTISFAQKDDKDEAVKGFKKDKLFTGGSVTASFGSGYTGLGLSPHFGYSIIKWLDAALSLNFNYISQRDYYVGNDKLRQTTLGPGAFVRIFPVNFLFAQAQYEHNFIRQKYIPSPVSGGTSEIYKVDANSLLVGAGYASSRSSTNNTYYYISLMFDVLKDQASPYRDNYQRVLPVIRAGYNIALFQGKRNSRD